MHLPLHIGTEVAVLHLDGDPDRPIIAGALPNVDDVSPVTSANATQSRIVTRSNILFELDDDAR
jgi:type VI secretion system secreted protein VgrG